MKSVSEVTHKANVNSPCYEWKRLNAANKTLMDVSTPHMYPGPLLMYGVEQRKGIVVV